MSNSQSNSTKIETNHIKQITYLSYKQKNSQGIDEIIPVGYKLEFDTNNSPNFNILDYVDRYIVLNTITKVLDIANNLNKPFIIVQNSEIPENAKDWRNNTDIRLLENEKKNFLIVRFQDFLFNTIDELISDSDNEYTGEDGKFIITNSTYKINDFGSWQPADSLWLRVTANIIKEQSDESKIYYNNIQSITDILSEGDQIQINLNLPNIDDNRYYKIFNIIKPYLYTATDGFSQFDINLQKTDADIISEQNVERYFTLVKPGDINEFEITGNHNINYINRHMYSIDLINKCRFPYYFGSNSDEIHKNVIANTLSIGNIPNEYIDADFPLTNDRLNGFHKITYIDDNNYKLITNSPIITYFDNNIHNTNNHIDTVTNIIYLNPNKNEIYIKNETDETAHIKFESTNIILKIQKIEKIQQGFLFPNHYIYQFGRTFENVKEIKLISSEFPNSSQVIHANTPETANNKIYWRLLDDGPFEYVASLDPGNYSANTLKLEIQDKMNKVTRCFNNNIFNEIIVVINSAKSLIEFRSFEKYTFANNLSIVNGSNRLEIEYDVNQDNILDEKDIHYIDEGDTIIISNADELGGISSNLINKEHIAHKINDFEFYVNLTTNATQTKIKGGGKKITIRKLIPMQILWNKPNSFGNLLGFNRANEVNYTQPPFMKVITNYEYNKYNDSESNNLFDISGEKYILMLNQLLTNMDTNSTINNIYAKILLPVRSGSYAFNTFLSESKIFDNPLSKLSELEFKFVNFYNKLFEFNGIDHSFTLQITEQINSKSIKSYNSKEII